jgi:hypothetical protein
MTNTASQFASADAVSWLEQLLITGATTWAAFVFLGVAKWENGICVPAEPIAEPFNQYDRTHNHLLSIYKAHSRLENPQQLQQQLELGLFAGKDQFELLVDNDHLTVTEYGQVLARAHGLNAYDDGKDPPGLAEGSDDDDDDAKSSGVDDTSPSLGLGQDKKAISVGDNTGKESKSGGVKRPPSGNKKGGGPKKKLKTEQIKKKSNTDTRSKKKKDIGIGVHHKSCLDKGAAHKPFKSKRWFPPSSRSRFSSLPLLD